MRVWNGGAPHSKGGRRLGHGRLFLVRGLVPAALELDDQRRRDLVLVPPLLLQLRLAALSSATEESHSSTARGAFRSPFDGELDCVDHEVHDEDEEVYDQGE